MIKVCKRCGSKKRAVWLCRKCGRKVCEHFAGLKKADGSATCSSCRISAEIKP